MKKIKYILLNILLILCSCTENVIDTNNNYSLSVEVADFVWENNTRSIPKVNDSGVSYRWQKNDTIGVFPNKGSQIEFIILEDGLATTAVFDGGAWTCREGYSYTAFYPFNYYNRSCSSIQLDYEGQYQTENNNLDNVGKKDYIYSNATTSENGLTHFSFQHVGAFLWLTLKMPNEVDLKELSLIAEESIIPIKQTIDLSSGSIVITQSELADTLQIKLNNIHISEDKAELSLYAMLPVITKENLKFNVKVTDIDDIEYNSETPISFLHGTKAGTAYKKKTNMLK